jgi:hypothetical protein
MILARWIALAMGVTVLLIAGGFIAAVLLRQEPSPSAGISAAPPPVTTPGMYQMSGQLGLWTVTVDLRWEENGAIAVRLGVANPDGQPVTPMEQPTAVMTAAGMAMDPVTVGLVQESVGRWRALVRLPHGGRWNIRVAIENQTVTLPFDTASLGPQ